MPSPLLSSRRFCRAARVPESSFPVEKASPVSAARLSAPIANQLITRFRATFLRRYMLPGFNHRRRPTMKYKLAPYDPSWRSLVFRGFILSPISPSCLSRWRSSSLGRCVSLVPSSTTRENLPAEGNRKGERIKAIRVCECQRVDTWVCVGNFFNWTKRVATLMCIVSFYLPFLQFRPFSLMQVLQVSILLVVCCFPLIVPNTHCNISDN